MGLWCKGSGELDPYSTRLPFPHLLSACGVGEPGTFRGFVLGNESKGKQRSYVRCSISTIVISYLSRTQGLSGEPKWDLTLYSFFSRTRVDVSRP